MGKNKRTEKAPKKEDAKARTYADVAARYKVHRDTVRRDWKAAGMPKLPATFESLDRWKATLKSKPATESNRITEAREAKMIAEASKREAEALIARHKARLLEDNIVSLEQVDHFLSLFLTEARMMLTRLPEEVASGYPGKIRHSLEEDLKARIDLILRALHGHAQTHAQIKE